MVTMVTRCTGSLFQLLVVEMSWGKKSKKKPSVLINFRFLVNFIRHIGPMVTMVARCTGSLSQLPVVKMSWHSVEFVPENGKSTPTFFKVQYLTQESKFCKNFKRRTQNIDMATVLWLF